jgi:hypothetical protein
MVVAVVVASSVMVAGEVAVADPTPAVTVAVGLFITGDVAVADTTAVVDGVKVGVVVGSQGMITLVSARVWFGPPLA